MQGPRLAVFDWTGEPQAGCAWRSLGDPFVARVMRAYAWFDNGQLAVFEPNASHRLIEGVGFYQTMLSICRAKAMELDREEERKKNRGNNH